MLPSSPTSNPCGGANHTNPMLPTHLLFRCFSPYFLTEKAAATEDDMWPRAETGLDLARPVSLVEVQANTPRVF